jgi:hypothetical protein
VGSHGEKLNAAPPPTVRGNWTAGAAFQARSRSKYEGGSEYAFPLTVGRTNP